MTNPIFPRFEEDNYKGQDVVHYGVRIPLMGVTASDLFKKFHHNAKRLIKKQLVESRYIFTATSAEDLAKLRKLWFDENDTTFPVEIGSVDHFGITASDESLNVCGAIIFTREGNNLFLHQLVSAEYNKKKDGLPTILIWEAVNKFIGQYNSIDVGVSYNPARYKFFCNFAVEKYPIILKKPLMTPVIRMSPFRTIQNTMAEKSEHRVQRLKEADITFFPRASYAIYGALKHIGVGKGDLVTIVKTFGSNYISGCVTKMVEKTGAEWKLRDIIRQATKAVIVVHEFGIPVYQERDMEIIRHAKELGIPIIEDCAWCIKSVLPEATMTVLSMQKIFNVNYGALLLGVRLDDDFMWSIGCLDFVKRDRFTREEKFGNSFVFDQRVKNWKQYHALVLADGMTPDDCYDYEKAIEKNEWVPTVYLQKFETEEIANEVMERLQNFGIEAGRYWGEPIVMLPVHQGMNEAEVEYMFAVVRGYFNVCRDWNK